MTWTRNPPLHLFYPRVQYGWMLDVDTGEREPLFLYSHSQIDTCHMLCAREKVDQRRRELHAGLEQSTREMIGRLERIQEFRARRLYGRSSERRLRVR